MLASLVVIGTLLYVASAHAGDPPAVDAPAVDAPVVDAPAAPAELHLVYTGGLGGVGAGDYPLSIVRELWTADASLDGHLAELAITHGAAAQGPWTLLAADRSVRSVVAALDGSGVACGEPELRPGIRTRTELLVMSQPGDSSLLDALAERGLSRETVGLRSCTSGDGIALILVGPSVGLPRSWALADWELRMALMGRWAEEEPSRRFIVAAAPIQEASRLTTEARRLLADQPDAIYVDAGNFLDGVSSARNDRLSLHRPLSWQMLLGLSPAALVPGETELAMGAKSFIKELAQHPLPYLATNWDAPAELELPDHRVVTVDSAQGPLRVAFVGVIDPSVAIWIPELDDEAVSITDPVSAVQATVDELVAGADPPDAVVILTTASGAVQAELRRRVRGVDLLLGDPTFATFRVRQHEAALRPLSAGEQGAPLTLSLDGLATADLSFDSSGSLVAVRSTPRLVGPELPVDPDLSAAITKTRAQVYPPLDQPLVPAADPDAPSHAWTADGWTELVCQALRRATHADTVLLREIPAPTRVPGPISELTAVEYLAMLDRVELYRVPGDKLQTVLDRAYGAVPVSCGAQPGADSPLVWGRAIESTRSYRVVTTDRTRVATSLGDILQGVSASGPLDPQGMTVLRGAQGRPWTIRAAVLDSLKRVRAGQADPDQAIRDFLESAPSVKPAEWLLRVRALSLAASRFQGADQPAFELVPETLATSPSSFTLTSSADLALEYDDPGVAWDLRYRSSYASQSTSGSDSQETSDDWKASTSVGLPTLSTTALLTWSPYSELLYDSEFTPTLDDSGVQNRLQSDLSLALGLSAAAVGHLSGLRVGGFANRDLAQLRTKPTEWGGKAELDTSVALGFLSWTTDSEGSVYANTSADDASDLRFKILADTKLSAPLARWLSIGLSAQGFLLEGRVPATQVVDGSWTLGATLDAAGIFEL
ncbi:MAG: hypothetical protein GXP62_00695 [Oligoflexia bacterium]|nr:hypothetical protein [Oligoflexia bacterium]